MKIDLIVWGIVTSAVVFFCLAFVLKACNVNVFKRGKSFCILIFISLPFMALPTFLDGIVLLDAGSVKRRTPIGAAEGITCIIDYPDIVEDYIDPKIRGTQKAKAIFDLEKDLIKRISVYIKEKNYYVQPESIDDIKFSKSTILSNSDESATVRIKGRFRPKKYFGRGFTLEFLSRSFTIDVSVRKNTQNSQWYITDVKAL